MNCTAMRCGALTWGAGAGTRAFAIYAGGVDGALTGAQTGALSGQARAYVRTLGGFELFAGGKAVLFSSAKAREMLALLVDRGGGFMTHEELIARLWPGEPVNALTLARCRKIAMRLKNTLREYGVEDIVEAAKSRPAHRGGTRRIRLCTRQRGRHAAW